jgi:hypothetical protein
VPHGLGTAAPPGTVGLAGVAGLVGAASPRGAAGPALWLVPGPMHLLSRRHNLDKRDRPRNVGLIEWIRLGSLGSMGPLVRPINHHNRHSKAILGIPEQRQFITWHGVGPAAPPNRQTGRN